MLGQCSFLRVRTILLWIACFAAVSASRGVTKSTALGAGKLIVGSAPDLSSQEASSRSDANEHNVVPCSRASHGFFRCRGEIGSNDSPMFSCILLVLAAVLLIVGTFSTVYERYIAVNPSETSIVEHPRLDFICLVGSAFGGCLVYVGVKLSYIMVVVGFGYCCHYGLMATYIVIIISAQVFAAAEYSSGAAGITIAGRAERFVSSFLQWRVFVDARESWKLGKVTHSFARAKFIDAIGESGPLALFAVYVDFYLHFNWDFWLSLSLVGSVIGVAAGITVWFDFTFRQQLEEEGIQAEVFSIRWYHHCLWFSYFTADFSLRLMTLGLFLSAERLAPHSLLVFVVLLVVYFVAAVFAINWHYIRARVIEVWHVKSDDSEEVYHVTRQVVLQRILDALILTFLVNALPADMRLAPKSEEDSRLLLALHPDVRSQLMKTLIPLRAADYIILGSVAMYVNYNSWQCLSLVALFIVTHLLLVQVISLRGPPVKRTGDERIHLISSTLNERQMMADA